MQEDQIAESKLTSAKIRNILKLEQLFHSKFLTVELLHQLISLYTCCIQSIDQSQQDLRTYFLQKIQFVLSRPEMQALLNAVNNSNEKNMAQNLRQTLRVTKRDQLSLHANTQALKPNFDRKRLHNYDGDNPMQKKKKIDIQLKLMAEMQTNMKSITSQVNAADIKMKNQNAKIQGIAKQQNNKLEQRLARRKNKKRKQSADQRNQQSPIKIDKKDLLKVQHEINDAVERITIRATKRQQEQEADKNIQNQNKQTNTKGRITKINRLESEE